MTKNSRQSRYTLGLDVWQCPDCTFFVVIGKRCKCGKSYADVLARRANTESAKKKEPDKKTVNDGIRYRPKSKGKYIESYLYRKNEE